MAWSSAINGLEHGTIWYNTQLEKKVRVVPFINKTQFPMIQNDPKTSQKIPHVFPTISHIPTVFPIGNFQARDLATNEARKKLRAEGEQNRLKLPNIKHTSIVLVSRSDIRYTCIVY